MKRLGGLGLRRLPPSRCRRRGWRGWRRRHDCRRGRRGRRGRRRDRRRNHGSRRSLGALRRDAEGWQRRCRDEHGCTRARLRCRRRGLRRADRRFAALTGRRVGQPRDRDPGAETCQAQQQSECQRPVHLVLCANVPNGERPAGWCAQARVIAANRAHPRRPAGRLGGRRRTAGRSRARRGWRP
ncbi:MAG: hypothetical protein QOF69_1215 [Solirubrobacteraceae bacterium]|nr:hypothetical protein [Solirubrobacteraceae bacterium]